MKNTRNLLVGATALMVIVGLMGLYAANLTSAQQAESTTTEDSKETTEDSKNTEDEEKYFELLKMFADTLDQVERNYVKPISRRELMEAAIDGVLAKLDAYSDYIAPEELDSFRTGIENEFGGIGIRVGMEDRWLTVITPLVGTPAYEAGILAGDRIIEIGGETTKGITMTDAVRKMKGPIGTTVALKVRHRHNGKLEELDVERSQIQVESILGYRRTDSDGWDFFVDKDQKIGYVRITSFSRKTAPDLRKAIRELQKAGAESLVLDLRFNPGGLLSAAVSVADLFLSDGTIVSTEGRNVKSRVWSAKKVGTFPNLRLAVLINQYSASASEIVAACLQDHERAIVVGERTWGKASVQNIIELEGGKSALKLTTAGYKRPSGKNIDRQEASGDEWGVQPSEGFKIEYSPVEIRDLLNFMTDVDVVASQDEVKPKPFDDRQLEKALDYLRTELARKD